VTLVRGKVAATFDDTAWKLAIDELKPSYDRACRLKQAELAALDQAIERLTFSLEVLTNADLIREAQAKYEARIDERKRLVLELAAAQEDMAQLDDLYELRNRCVSDLEHWDTVSQDERRAVLHGLIDRIEAEQIEGRAIRFTVRWRDGEVNSFVSAPQTAYGSQRWLPSEADRLMALVDAGASQLELCAAFPDRKWSSIYRRIYSDRKKSFRIGGKHTVRLGETYNQYLKRFKSVLSVSKGDAL
jgi:hypothetical protein